MNIFYSSKFLRAFERLPKEIRDSFREKEATLRENHFDARLKTHKLKSKDEWSFLVTYKIRVIFIFEKGNVLLVDIGDHSIYRRK